VGQEPVLFRGSVAENIERGRADADTNSVALDEALQAAEQEYKQKHPFSCCPKPVPGHKEDHTPHGSEQDIEMAQPRTSEDIIAAATASCAHDFISSFPQVQYCIY
jgi:ABC-type multidrug transport system fused ATPase/permease subunit